MKIENRTQYPLRVLRSILCAVHDEEAKKPYGRLPKWKIVHVTIKTSKSNEQGFPMYWGDALLRGDRATLAVPAEKLSVPLFVALWRHELHHLYGVDHHDMSERVLRLDTRGTGYAIKRFGRVLREKT